MGMLGQVFPKMISVIGHPISHSLSPKMHSAMLLELNLENDFSYGAVDVADEMDLSVFVDVVRGTHYAGFNVTVPYKEAIMGLLDDIHDEARAIGAVNTVVKTGDRLIGYNTDGRGFLMALEREFGFDVAGKSVVILGSGGSARAIGYSILKAGARSLYVMNRTVSRAENLVNELSAFAELAVDFDFGGIDAARLSGVDLVIQTTSLGMRGAETGCVLEEFDWVDSNSLCCDIIYEPPETIFLKQCNEMGARVMNGKGMLAGQGVLAFELFTGKPGKFDVMASVIN